MSSQSISNPPTLSLPWGGDLQLTNNGSIAFVSGVGAVEQRIIRRYFTCPAEILADGSYVPTDYIFDPGYGIGATRLIGQPVDDALAATLTQKIKAAVLIDEGVDTTQDPDIALYVTTNGAIWANVTVYLLNGQSTTFNFPAQGNNSQ